MNVETVEQVEQTPVEQEVQDAEASPVESNEQKLDGLLEQGASRMAHEHLKPQPEAQEPAPEKASEADEQPEANPAEDAQPLEAPAHWSEERRAEFSSLPPAAQKILTERHKEMERGYNDKFQELAKQRTETQAWQQLTQRIQSDPQFAQHVFSYGQQPEQPETPPTFDDPVAELEYNAAQRAREEVLKEITPQLEQQRALEQQVQIQSVLAKHQRDPLFQEVDTAMREYIDSQPTDAMKAHLYRTLDSNPQAYTETYAALRQSIAQKAAQPEAPAQPAQVERKVTPREAPKLEEAGGPVNNEGGKRSKRLSELTKKIKSNRAELDDIGKYIEMTARF